MLIEELCGMILVKQIIYSLLKIITVLYTFHFTHSYIFFFSLFNISLSSVRRSLLAAALYLLSMTFTVDMLAVIVTAQPSDAAKIARKAVLQ